MNTISDRIRIIIDELCGGNRSKFAREINVSAQFAAQLYDGSRIPSDRTISDVCRVFNINEPWLRNGTGRRQPPRPRGEEIGDIVKAAARHDPEEAAKFFRTLLEDMSDAEIVLMYEVLRRHFPEK